MAELFERLKNALADCYAIEREIGRGGMAVVYLAEDLRHHRQVAVKVLQPEVAATVGSDRFLREIETAAQLSHPHILPLHDSGAADGFLYYVMPYVEGQSLRERIDREGQLPVDDALRIAREVADGIGHAHEHDVVHRDVKPGNILHTRDHAIVADFGIATAIAEAGGDRVTRTGMSVGSPVYMSPEQAAGTGPVDGRSDVYSLGCVLYEMLVGEPPFSGSTPQVILARKSTDTAPSPRAIRETVPVGVDAAITKALARSPADRFTDARAFSAALSAAAVPGSGQAGRESADPEAVRGGPRRTGRFGRLAVVAAVALVLAVAAWLTVGRGTDGGSAESSGRDLRSIAVLPFATRTADATEDASFFADGIHDDVLTQLSKVDSLKVISRTSVMTFRSTDQTIPEIAEKLGVATVLEGSVQRAGDRVRVNVQLIDADSDEHLWAETYDRELTAENLFAIQADMAVQIAGALRATLTPQTAARLEAKPTTSLAAYELYVRGRYTLDTEGLTQAAVLRAKELFEEALEADSTYAAAYAGLAETYQLSWQPLALLPMEEALPAARNAAETALRLDESLPDAHLSMGNVLAAEQRWSEAEDAFLRALDLSPGFSEAMRDYAHLLIYEQRFDEAVPVARLAVETDPLSLRNRQRLAAVLMFSRDYEAAIEVSAGIVELEPEYPWGYYYLGASSALNRNSAEAIRAFQRAMELEPDQQYIVVGLAYAHATAGDRTTTLEILERLDHSGPILKEIAIVYGELGDIDLALEYLERAYEEDPASLASINADPGSDTYRDHPRFKQLMRRMGLESEPEP